MTLKGGARAVLRNLHIENVAVIQQADIDFDRGFTVLTGETGAGKSILIDSINLILGEKASREMVRTGAAAASVSALFTDLSEAVVQKILSLGIDVENGELLLQKEVRADGRSSARVNGVAATSAMLRECGRLLVDIHGQHSSHLLLQNEMHLQFVDDYAQVLSLREAYGEAYDRYMDLCAQERRLTMDEKEKQRRIEMLEYQLKEIDSAGLEKGEEEQLQDSRSLLVNAEKITKAVEAAQTALFGGEGSDAEERVDRAKRALNSLSDTLPAAKELALALQEIAYALNDCERQLSDLAEEAGEGDTASLDRIEGRLQLIGQLKRKYGETVEEILAYGERCRNELDDISFSDRKLELLGAKKKEVFGQLVQCGEALSQKRREAAAIMDRRIMEELAFLDMQKVQFQTAFVLTDPGEMGMDQVEFTVSTNPGEPLKPLSKIASGGELSRLMLALKNVIADREGVQTLIFDEVDTGVSGRAAQKIAVKLKEVSKAKQVFCVTHQAQVGAKADTHLLISKTERDGRVFTGVTELDRQARISELARMISGEEITDSARAAVTEMLDE